MKDTITLAYDSVNWTAIRQHESVLISIMKVYQDEIIKGRITVQSVENSSMHLNVITVTLSPSMSYNRVNEILQTINTTAYYTLRHDARAEVFKQYAEYVKSL